MSYTLADLQAGIQARGYATDTAAAQTTFLNSVGRYATLLRRWRWREATANLVTIVGNPSVSLTPLGTSQQDIDAIRLQVSSTDNSDLTYWEPLKLRYHLQLDQTNGRPRHWTRFANGVLVYPRPDAVYTLPTDYLTKWVELVNPTDVPVLPEEYRELLIYGALADLSERKGNSEQRTEWLQAYDRVLATMEEADGRTPRQTSSRVVESGFFDDTSDHTLWPFVS